MPVNECSSDDCDTPMAPGFSGTGFCLPCLRFGWALVMGLDREFAEKLADHDSGPVDLTVALIDERGVQIAHATTDLRLEPSLFRTDLERGTPNRNETP